MHTNSDLISTFYILFTSYSPSHRMADGVHSQSSPRSRSPGWGRPHLGDSQMHSTTHSLYFTISSKAGMEADFLCGRRFLGRHLDYKTTRRLGRTHVTRCSSVFFHFSHSHSKWEMGAGRAHFWAGWVGSGRSLGR